MTASLASCPAHPPLGEKNLCGVKEEEEGRKGRKVEQSGDAGEREREKQQNRGRMMTEEDKTGEEGGCEKRGGNVAYVVSYCWLILLKNA